MGCGDLGQEGVLREVCSPELGAGLGTFLDWLDTLCWPAAVSPAGPWTRRGIWIPLPLLLSPLPQWLRRSQPWSSRSLVQQGPEVSPLPFLSFPEAGGPACALIQPSTIVREGFLLKRKEEPAGLATRFAFKKRYFRLSGQDLSYSKTPEWQVRLQPQEGVTRVLGETEAQGGS